MRAPSAGLLAPIPTPPRTNEHRHGRRLGCGPAWLRRMPYPRAALSSLVYNLAGAALWLPPAVAAPPAGRVAPAVLSGLLHAMGALSLANWTARTELARLLDVSCMLCLKAHFLALGLGLEGRDGAMAAWTAASVAGAGVAVCGLRLADGGRADRLMAPLIAALLAVALVRRPAVLLEPPEGMGAFVAGYACKLADVRGAAPRCLWWTAAFHALTAHAMLLAGLTLRGAEPRAFAPALLPRSPPALLGLVGAAGCACVAYMCAPARSR
jgi:hypothetical protein